MDLSESFGAEVILDEEGVVVAAPGLEEVNGDVADDEAGDFLVVIAGCFLVVIAGLGGVVVAGEGDVVVVVVWDVVVVVAAVAGEDGVFAVAVVLAVDARPVVGPVRKSGKCGFAHS